MVEIKVERPRPGEGDWPSLWSYCIIDNKCDDKGKYEVTGYDEWSNTPGPFQTLYLTNDEIRRITGRGV